MSAAGGDKHGENAGDCQQDGDQRHGQTTGFLFGIDHVPLLAGAPAAGVAAGGIGCFWPHDDAAVGRAAVPGL